MARWGLLASLALIIFALFLGNGVLTNYAGDVSWESDSAGLLSGIIHGALAPLMLIAAIFTDYNMYETRNIGWLYDFGFLIGLLIIWGGGHGTNHVVKNYYGDKKPRNLTEEDHKKIANVVEQKIDKKLDEHHQKHIDGKPRESILVGLFTKKSKKKSIKKKNLKKK